MALVAELGGELGLRRAGGERVAARAANRRLDVLGMDVGLHGCAPVENKGTVKCAGNCSDSQSDAACAGRAMGSALGDLGEELVVRAERAQAVDEHLEP